mgnify:CR=1 FL=1
MNDECVNVYRIRVMYHYIYRHSTHAIISLSLSLSLSSVDIYKACLSFSLNMIWNHEVAHNKHYILRVAVSCFSITSL